MSLRSWIPSESLIWEKFCSNIRASSSFLEHHLDKVDWDALSYNANAIQLFENNLDKVSWYNLSANTGAISILEQNLDKVDWPELSRNPSAISIL